MSAELAGVLWAIPVLGALLTAIHWLPASWGDDRALMRPIELPDAEMLEAMREVDALTPAAPPIEPGAWLRSLVPPAAERAEVRPAPPTWAQIGMRPPPPPPPKPTRAPGPGILARR